jgi:hypothetical protein
MYLNRAIQARGDNAGFLVGLSAGRSNAQVQAGSLVGN